MSIESNFKVQPHHTFISSKNTHVHEIVVRGRRYVICNIQNGTCTDIKNIEQVKNLAKTVIQHHEKSLLQDKRQVAKIDATGVHFTDKKQCVETHRQISINQSLFHQLTQQVTPTPHYPTPLSEREKDVNNQLTLEQQAIIQCYSKASVIQSADKFKTHLDCYPELSKQFVEKLKDALSNNQQQSSPLQLQQIVSQVVWNQYGEKAANQYISGLDKLEAKAFTNEWKSFKELANQSVTFIDDLYTFNSLTSSRTIQHIWNAMVEYANTDIQLIKRDSLPASTQECLRTTSQPTTTTSTATPLPSTNKLGERNESAPIGGVESASLSRDEERQRKIDHFSLIEKLIQGCSVTSPIISKKEIALQTLQILQSGEFLELQKTLKPEHLKLLKDNIETIKTGYKRSVSENLYYDRLISFLQIDSQFFPF